ncbi:MAK10-like protein [Tanacetum coccineum]
MLSDPVGAMNQVVIQDGRVDIQSRNVGYAGNGSKNVERINRNQATNAGNGFAQKTGEIEENVQRIPRTTTTLGKTNVQCYNCNGKGHYARDYPKPRVCDAKYFKEQMLLAVKDKVGVNLDTKENDFMLMNAYDDDQLEELNASVIISLMLNRLMMLKLSVRSVILSVSSLNEPKSRVFPPKAIQVNPSASYLANPNTYYAIGHVHVEKAYIDPNSPLDIMTRMMYNWIMRRKLDPREDPNREVSNFTGRVKGMHIFIGNFTYVSDFMIVEDISSIINPRLSQVVLEKPFYDVSKYDHDLLSSGV